MSSFAVIALVGGALATVLLVAAVIAIVVQRVRQALREATRATERLTAASAEFSDQQQVTGRELDRLSAAIDELRTARGR